MDVRITVEATYDNGEKRTHQLDNISPPYRVTCPEDLCCTNRLRDSSCESSVVGV